MKLFSSLPVRAYVVLGTLMVLLSLFAYYFWVYLPRQEELLIAKRVRALQQMANSFKEKDAIYRKTAHTIYGKTAANEKIHCNSPEGMMMLRKVLADDAVNMQLRIEEESFETTAGEIEYLREEEDNKGGCRIKLVTSLENFIAPLRREDSFDQYILFKENKVAYRTIEGEILQLLNGSSSLGFNIDSLLNASHKKDIINIRLDRQSSEPEIFETGLNVKVSAVNYKLFSTHFDTDDGKVWTIYALVNAESFEAAKKKVSVMVVIIIAVALLVLIFALPLIKLSLISPIERLHRVDVVLSTSSFVICTGLMVLFLLFAFSYLSDSRKADRQLEKLSTAIEDSVSLEMRSIRQVMHRLEDVAYTQAENSEFEDINIFSDSVLSVQLQAYAFLKNLYWLDSSGDLQYQLSTVTPRSRMLAPMRFQGRAYFHAIAEGRGWQFEQPAGSTPFFLQSISSWTNSEKLLVFSVPSKRSEMKVGRHARKNIKVLAASVRFHSLMDPLLPRAFGFCVIDENGQVLFHSDKQKNLLENFLTEVDTHDGVLSALMGKNSAFADVNHGGTNHRVYIQPLDNTPWFLITSYDKAYRESPYLQIISLCVLCILIIGGLAFSQLYFISLFKRSTSKLRKLPFHYDWLWPVDRKKESYFKAMLYNVALGIALCIYHWLSDMTVLQVLASFLYAVVFASSSVWMLLSDATDKQGSKGITILGLTLIVSFLMLGITVYFTQDIGTNMSIWCIVAALSLLPHLSVRKLSIDFRKISGKLSFKQAYWGMLFTFLFISSVLPTFFLYHTAYEQEQKIWKKHEMYQLSEAEEERSRYMRGLYTTANADSLQQANLIRAFGKEHARYTRSKALGSYYQHLGYQSCHCKDVRTFAQIRWDSLLYKSRPFFTNMFVASNGFVFSGGGDQWDTQQCDRHGIRMEYRSPHSLPQDSVILAATVSSLEQAFYPDRPMRDIFWICLGLMLLAVYYIIRFATNQFFALKLFNNLQAMQMDDQYLEHYFDHGDAVEVSKHLFVIALPFTGAHKLYGKSHQVYDVPELLHPEECAKILQVKEKHVVLEHFSYVIEDTKANRQILDIVERLLRNRNNIIIISRLSPTQIIDKYEAMIRQINDQQQRAELEVQVSKWKDILAGFVKVYYSLLHGEALQQKFSNDFTLKELLAYEFRVNEAYFKRIREAFAKKWEGGNIELSPALEAAEKQKDIDSHKHRDVKEEVLLKIQSMAQPFYFSLWNTCSKEEKYLLYDLAMDGFVNTKNERGLKKLLEKGLVYYNESLQVMNESFRNFILSTIKASESLAMEKELRQSGTWSLYSTLFLILVMGLILFVALSQQEIISQFVALLAGLATAIPYLLRFSGFFSSLTGKSKIAVQAG